MKWISIILIALVTACSPKSSHLIIPDEPYCSVERLGRLEYAVVLKKDLYPGDLIILADERLSLRVIKRLDPNPYGYICVLVSDNPELISKGVRTSYYRCYTNVYTKFARENE